MDLIACRKMVKKYDVKKWIEAGTDVLKVGDKLVTKGETYSRLNRYQKDGTLQFCTEKEQRIPCGSIFLGNDEEICYNVVVEKLECK